MITERLYNNKLKKITVNQKEGMCIKLHEQNLFPCKHNINKISQTTMFNQLN